MYPEGSPQWRGKLFEQMLVPTISLCSQNLSYFLEGDLRLLGGQNVAEMLFDERHLGGNFIK